MFENFPPEYRDLKALAEAAVAQWCPGATISFARMGPGLSGAGVFRIDVSGAATLLASGQYILKLTAKKEKEVDAYTKVFAFNRKYAETHIPPLLRQFDSLQGQAMLFDIAGASLDSYSSIDGRENPAFDRLCGTISRDLLDHWTQPTPELLRPHELLERWLEGRLDPERGKRVREIVDDLFGTSVEAVIGRRAVFNPLAFYEVAKEQAWGTIESLPGLLHGDLHGGNLLLHRNDPEPGNYWVIDVTQARNGPSGFDQAYLELSFILDNLQPPDPAQLFTALETVESAPRADEMLPPIPRWIVNNMRRIRSAISDWQQAVHQRRPDVVRRQFLLARVAAGLNWANKRLLSDPRRLLAISYAAWHAARYVEHFEPDAWPTQPKKKKMIEQSEEDLATWRALWDLAGGFAASSGRFILAAEALGDSDRLRTLGHIPWSAVIDLDPSSDEAGLQHHAAAVLETHRSIHPFSRTPVEVNYARGTAWLMTAGWKRKRETPTTYDQWRWANLSVIRDLIKSVDTDANPEPLYVVLLPGATLDADMPLRRLAQIAGAADEVTRGRARIILLGGRELPDPVRHEHVPLEVDLFISNLETVFGTTAFTEVAQIPGGPDGALRPLPIEALRSIEENMEVLHSHIVEQPCGEVVPSDSFWRGHPPTWTDFLTSHDIERPIHRDLVKTLQEWLDPAGRNRTVLLYHTPGAGGTTAALRAAWDLRVEYPVAVLRRASPALSTRLQQLYQIAERPVLLVAEASDLTESAREDLYRDLSLHNTRVVLLYIRRELQTEREGLMIADPIPRDEAIRFMKAYQALTKEPRRREELSRITYDDTLEKYRSPFFYGLVTFERDFEPVERYVTAHIRAARGIVRDILQYLALTTIFSNTGLHEGIIRKLVGLSEDSQLTLPQVLGEGPARLTLRKQGRLRLMHQVIAEEVLASLSGGDDWNLDLHTIATAMIRDVTRAVAPDSTHVLDLFRQIFTERQGGGLEDEDRQDFSPLIEAIDTVNRSLGHGVLHTLTECCPGEAHFWNHLGRHQVYRGGGHDLNKAEEYLERAVQLSPTDSLHYHTRGLVRRARLRQELSAAKRGGVAGLVERLAWFNGAASDFEHTRKLDPENIYGYVTHIQMILYVAERLKTVADVKNIASVGPEASGWLQEHLAIAAHLLDDARRLYGTLDKRNSYLTDCIAALERVYGNFDEVIRIWEVAQARGTSDAHSRRALANAYLGRSGNSWAQLQESELRRIVDLMEVNLNSRARNEDDYRLWFEAYKLLPDFDVDHALGQLKLWSVRFASWRAHFYTYVLQFLLWFEGRTTSTDEMQIALEACKQTAFGRRGTSLQWLAQAPMPCPLISNADLGEWDSTKNFWPNSSPLRRINGVIDEHIPRPQAGTIKIDGEVQVFFVPALGKFFANSDENKAVSFYLGFSAVGLRAWEVQRGQVEGGDRAAFAATVTPTPVILEPAPVALERKRERVRALNSARIAAFINDLVSAHMRLGARLTVGDVVERMEATFGVDHLLDEVAVNVRQILSSHYRLVPDGLDLLIEEYAAAAAPPSTKAMKTGRVQYLNRREEYGFIAGDEGVGVHFRLGAVVSAHRDAISKDHRVEYAETAGDKGPIAIRVSLADPNDLLEGEALRQAVKQRVLAQVLEARDQAHRIDDLEAFVKQEFGPRIARRLGFSTFAAFLSTVVELTINGVGADRVVFLRDRDGDLAFGRLPIKARQKPTARPRPAAPPKPPAAPKRVPGPAAARPSMRVTNQRLRILAAKEAIAFIISRGGVANGADLGNHLSARFPDREEPKVLKRLGYKTLAQFVASVPDLESSLTESGLIVRIPFVETVIQIAIAELKQMNGMLNLNTLGGKLGKRFSNNKALVQRLGYRSLLDFFRNNDAFVIDASTKDAVIRLA